MKKFFAGLIVGHIATNFLYLWSDGGFDRIKNVVDYHKEHPGEPLNPQMMFKYILEGEATYASQPIVPEAQLEPAVEEPSSRLRVQAERIHQMHVAGYSSTQIAEYMGVPENAVSIVLAFMGELEA